MSRTALIARVPPVDALVSLRQQYAADAAKGVSPHITILFPFMPTDQLRGSNREILHRVIGGVNEFDFTLATTGWFGEQVLWLAPADPSPFLALTDAVSAAFPEYPPYGGVHEGSVPHATVGDSGSADALASAEKAVVTLLPIKGTVTAITIIAEDADGSWHELADVPLSSRR